MMGDAGNAGTGSGTHRRIRGSYLQSGSCGRKTVAVKGFVSARPPATMYDPGRCRTGSGMQQKRMTAPAVTRRPDSCRSLTGRLACRGMSRRRPNPPVPCLTGRGSYGRRGQKPGRVRRDGSKIHLHPGPSSHRALGRPSAEPDPVVTGRARKRNDGRCRRCRMLKTCLRTGRSGRLQTRHRTRRTGAFPGYAVRRF